MDLRALMKVSRAKKDKINHPHIKYNSLGKISCIICGIQIKSELTWNAHIMSKSHKENAIKHVKPLKRMNNSLLDLETKVPKLEQVSISTKISNKQSSQQNEDKEELTNLNKVPSNRNNRELKDEQKKSECKIPEGFYDDPWRDAKVRNVPFKDKMDEQLELFVKELGSLNNESEEIHEKDNIQMVADRNILEIENQMNRWERINHLDNERQKQLYRKCGISNTYTSDANCGDVKVVIKQEEPTDVGSTAPLSEDEDELDEIFDFRRKTGLRQ